jgi:DNA helicase HerA-like ATPase
MIWNPDSVTMIGTAFSRRGNKPFGIRLTDRLQHIYILGQTGTGKSTLMGNLMREDMRQGHGFCLIDPHGDLAKKIAQVSPDDAVIWNVADPDCPYGYNPMTRASEKFRPLIASGLIDTLKKQWADAWGARMEHLLRYSILALLDQPRTDVRCSATTTLAGSDNQLVRWI